MFQGLSMNWLGDLVQKEVNKNDTVLDLGCGIMACTLDTCPTYPKTRLKCRHITGVDVHTNYLHLLKERPYITVVKGMLPDDLYVFVDSSFDVVLLLDIIEHLEYERSMKLIDEAKVDTVSAINKTHKWYIKGAEDYANDPDRDSSSMKINRKTY